MNTTPSASILPRQPQSPARNFGSALVALLSVCFFSGIAFGQTDDKNYPTDALPLTSREAILGEVDEKMLVFREKFGSDTPYDASNSLIGIRNAASIKTTPEGLEITDTSDTNQPATFISFRNTANLYPFTMDITFKANIGTSGSLRFVCGHSNGRMNHVFVQAEKIFIPQGDSQRIATQDQVLSLRLVFDEQGRGRIVSKNNPELNLGITANSLESKSSHLTLILKDATLTLMEVALYSKMP